MCGQKDLSGMTGLTEQARLPVELLFVLGCNHFPITNNIKVVAGEDQEA